MFSALYKKVFYVLVLGPPDTPSLVAVDVTGSHTVNVRYQEPESQDSAACTKYKSK